MTRSLMATYVLVALALPTFVHGHPAINDDNGKSTSSMLVARGAKSMEDLSDREAISPLLQKMTSNPPKSRQKRLSDQRRAELETLMTLSKLRARLITVLGNKQVNGRLDPAIIGRRKRSTTGVTPSVKLLPVRSRIDKAKRNGDAAYPLIS